MEFQSTLPRRERPIEQTGVIAVMYISIHAPAKGATTVYEQQLLHSTISIHAPAKGATFRCMPFIVFLVISIHAPAKGATKK